MVQVGIKLQLNVNILIRQYWIDLSRAAFIKVRPAAMDKRTCSKKARASSWAIELAGERCPNMCIQAL